jgi:hypothetical protein
MKKIMLFCLTLIAFSAMTNAQTRGAKTGKIEQAQTRATNATNTTPAAGKPAKESKADIEAADQKDRDNAQDDAENAGEKKDKIKDLLGLTDEQNAQFKAITSELRQAIKAIRKDAALPKADKMTQIKALNDARDAKLKGIFTAEQFTKWLQLAKNKAGNHMGKGRHKSDN